MAVSDYHRYYWKEEEININQENEFVKKTREGLKENYEEDLLDPRAFEFEESINENASKDCILIMGLNPAGGKDEADRVRNKKMPFLYYVPTIEESTDCQWLYSKYFKPIYELAEKTMENVNWPWCNMEWGNIENIICTNIPNLVNPVKNYYDQAQGGKTIYIGDMFYYHKTKSKELPLRNERQYDYAKYCEEMLLMHIKKLKDMGKNIRYVYINNAKVSRWFRPEGEKTCFCLKEYPEIPIFLGSMLSGQRAMDVFSRERLVNEIKSIIK